MYKICHIVKININLTDLQLSCLCTKYCINNEFNYINLGSLEQDVKNSSNTSLNGFGNNESIDDIDITDDKNITNKTIKVNDKNNDSSTQRNCC